MTSTLMFIIFACALIIMFVRGGSMKTAPTPDYAISVTSQAEASRIVPIHARRTETEKARFVGANGEKVLFRTRGGNYLVARAIGDGSVNRKGNQFRPVAIRPRQLSVAA
jgi:hypothetical protein